VESAANPTNPFLVHLNHNIQNFNPVSALDKRHTSPGNDSFLLKIEACWKKSRPRGRTSPVFSVKMAAYRTPGKQNIEF